MMQGLPLALHQLIMSSDFKGGALIQLESELSRPTAGEITLNHCWIRPFVRKYPQKVCSGFFMVDVFLRVDRLMQKKLLQPTAPGESKTSLASAEARKMKKLIGALRNLWRSSHSRD